jgi:hypothetical protein
MEKSKTGAENESSLPLPPSTFPLQQSPIVEKPKTGVENESLLPLPPSAFPLHQTPIVEKSKTGAETVDAQFEKVRSQIHAMRKVFSNNGSVRSYWKNYRGQRFGPYYRVAYTDAGQRHSIYLGKS